MDHADFEKLNDRSFLLAKKRIDQEITSLLLDAQKKLAAWLDANPINLPTEVSIRPRKIAKGENYADMPYWVSDFPAQMKGKDIWTFRTVVWWGHCISFSLIIAGKFKKSLSLTPVFLNEPEVFFTIAPTPWKLEFSDEIQKECMSLTIEEMAQHFENQDFLKISVQEKLENINKLEELTVLSFEKLMKALNKLA